MGIYPHLHNQRERGMTKEGTEETWWSGGGRDQWRKIVE